jgi:hypothetical protein
METLHIWAVVDKNGTEWLYNHVPLRSNGSGKYWRCNDDVFAPCFVQIPTGTMEFIVGKKIYWEDEPIRLFSEIGKEKK